MNESPRTSKRRRFLLALGIAMSLPCSMAAQPPTVDISNQVERFAPVRRNGVPNRYIVILEDQLSPTDRPSRAKGPSVAEVASDLARLHAATPLRTWDLALPGFLVELPEEAARALSRDPRVRLVEQDAYVEPQNATEDCGQQTSSFPRSNSFPTSPQSIQCADPHDHDATGCVDNWGLDRIDQQSLPRNDFYNFDLTTPSVTIHAYLLDTGITAGHQEFSSRIDEGINASVDWDDPERHNITDCSENGHGTHVAGILGGMTYGVAKDVRIHPVKVGCTGTEISSFVEGIEWIIADRANRSPGQPVQPAVANFSFNGPEFPNSIAAAIAATKLVQSGVTLVQSAGNQNKLAAIVTMVGSGFPQEIIIAGGMDEGDGRWTRSSADPSYLKYCCTDPNICPILKDDCGSNYGPAVDIWAPASHIVSSSQLANNAICWLSGTSMAAPHVAGAAALLLGRFPNASPSAVEEAIKDYGTQNAVAVNDNQSTKTLLYSRFPATGGPVAGDDRFFISPNVSRDITFDELLAGDFDWDQDPLSIVFPFGTPTSGQLQVFSNKVRYTPATGFTGEDTFQYTVTDGHGNSDHAWVRIRVEEPRPPLEAKDDYFHVGQLAFYISNQIMQTILDNDLPTGGVRFDKFVRNPEHGTLDPLTRAYTPNQGFTGDDSFVYRIQENDTLLKDDATVHLMVHAPTGWVDGYDQQHIWGWACDPEYPAQTNRVDIYTTSWQYLGQADANHPSSGSINNICRGGSAHYFDFHHNGAIAPGTHFMVWSINLPYGIPGNDNWRISGTGSIGDGYEFVMPPPVCLDNLNLSNQTITTTQVFEACHTITATNFAIASSGNVTLHTVDWVALGSGFSVSLGGQLKVVVP